MLVGCKLGRERSKTMKDVKVSTLGTAGPETSLNKVGFMGWAWGSERWLLEVNLRGMRRC